MHSRGAATSTWAAASDPEAHPHGRAEEEKPEGGDGKMPALPARKSFDQMMRKALAKTTGPLVPKTMSVAEMICHGFYQCYKCHSVEIQHNGLLLPYCTRCGGEELRWVPGIDETGKSKI